MRSWLSWTDSAIPYLLNTKFFPIIQGQGLVSGGQVVGEAKGWLAFS